jgi:hypothetical protein
VAELDHRGPISESAQDEPDAGIGRSEKAAADSETEAEKWLRIFGDISEAAELSSDRDRSNRSIGQADVAAMKEEIDRQDSAGDAPVAKRPPGKSRARGRRN